MADSETVRSKRRERLRMASGKDMGTYLQIVRQVVEELRTTPTTKQKLFEAVKAVFQTKQDLDRILTDKPANAQSLEAHLDRYRNACKTVLLLDYEFAHDAYIEEQLRVAHTSLRALYRKKLQALRQQKDKHIETRRAHADYLKFIKASQTFYRLLVSALDRIHGGIPELRKAAQSWKDVNLADEAALAPAVTSTVSDKKDLLFAIQRTLLILGDLSRWRASDLDGNKPNRGAALGYYHLANGIYPPSGIAWNPLALIELEGDNINYLQGLYYIYRGLCATGVRSGPKLNLLQNLEIIFTKVTKKMDRKQLLLHMNRASNNVAGALMTWFLWLQIICAKGDDYPNFNELEKEVMSQLTNEIKKGSAGIDSLTQKIVLINLGADHHTGNKMKEDRDDKVMQSFFYLLRSNATMFHTLLNLFNSQLEFAGDRQDVKNQGASADEALADKLTAVMRTTLPVLRFYSVWFQNYWRILGANLPGFKIAPHEVEELWLAYAHCLNLLSNSFPVAVLPVESYLLPEDDDTIGFGPFFEQITHRNWFNEHGLKPKYSDANIKRDVPANENLSRIRGLLLDGKALCQDQDAPIIVSSSTNSAKPGSASLVFVYQAPQQPSSEPAYQQQNQQQCTEPPLHLDGTGSINTPQTYTRQDATRHSYVSNETITYPETTIATGPKDQALSKMVDNLLDDAAVEPLYEENKGRVQPTTPHQQTFNASASPLTNQLMGSPGYDGFTGRYSGQADFPLFPSANSPQTHTHEENEIIDMSRRLSSMGRTTGPHSPTSRTLPSLPALPHDSSRIWGVGYGGSAQAFSPAPGFARPVVPPQPSQPSPMGYTNGIPHAGSNGVGSSSPWAPFSSPTTDAFRRESLPHPTLHGDAWNASPSTPFRSGHRQTHSGSISAAPGSGRPSSGLGSAALGGSILPSVEAGIWPAQDSRMQWPK